MKNRGCSPRSGRQYISPRLQAGGTGIPARLVEPAERATEILVMLISVARSAGSNSFAVRGHHPPPEGGGYGSFAGFAGLLKGMRERGL